MEKSKKTERALLSALIVAQNKNHELKDLLKECLTVPFFEDREKWENWVSDFRPRVFKAIHAKKPTKRTPFPWRCSICQNNAWVDIGGITLCPACLSRYQESYS